MLRIINDHLLPLGKHSVRSKHSCHSLCSLIECLYRLAESQVSVTVSSIFFFFFFNFAQFVERNRGKNEVWSPGKVSRPSQARGCWPGRARSPLSHPQHRQDERRILPASSEPVTHLGVGSFTGDPEPAPGPAWRGTGREMAF